MKITENHLQELSDTNFLLQLTKSYKEILIQQYVTPSEWSDLDTRKKLR